jgi:hypothetical protein
MINMISIFTNGFYFCYLHTQLVIPWLLALTPFVRFVLFEHVMLALKLFLFLWVEDSASVLHSDWLSALVRNSASRIKSDLCTYPNYLLKYLQTLQMFSSTQSLHLFVLQSSLCLHALEKEQTTVAGDFDISSSSAADSLRVFFALLDEGKDVPPEAVAKADVDGGSEWCFPLIYSCCSCGGEEDSDGACLPAPTPSTMYY